MLCIKCHGIVSFVYSIVGTRGAVGWVFFSPPFSKEIPKFLSMKKGKEHSHKNNPFQKIRISTVYNIKLISQQLNINDTDITVFLKDLINFSALC